MKQQIISEVVQQMLPHLDNAQMQQLQKVLENTLFGCEITAQTEKKDMNDNQKLIDAFVSAKRIEGCSEKTLKYYRTTIEMMVASTDKGIRHIQTEDLRSYLTDYQSKNQSSRVTIDNIRRILSSFFSTISLVLSQTSIFFPMMLYRILTTPFAVSVFAETYWYTPKGD